MAYQFTIRAAYTKRDIYRIIGKDENAKGGNWDTGYVRHGDDHFIFCNIGVAGRTGHDYPNAWDGDKLVWYGKSRSHVDQPSIKRLTSGSGLVYLFSRDDSSKPFTFQGVVTPVTIEATSPVRIVWSVSALGPRI